MQFKSQIVVLGAKASKGEFNGRPLIQPQFITKPIFKMVKILRVKLVLKLNGVRLLTLKRLKIKIPIYGGRGHGTGF